MAFLPFFGEFGKFFIVVNLIAHIFVRVSFDVRGFENVVFYELMEGTTSGGIFFGKLLEIVAFGPLQKTHVAKNRSNVESNFVRFATDTHVVGSNVAADGVCD